MSMNGRRPQNPPPADAFTNYRPTAPPSSATSAGPPQRNISGGSFQGTPPSRDGGPRDAAPREGGERSGSSSKPPPLTLEQSRAVARTHYGALKGWLTKEGALTSASTRTNAREKLTRLTRQQFQELSTDVYDELMRRMEDASGRPGEQPFLPVRPDFHPKRNQARQKLATLPILRFRDLASDVYYELDRRYPEFAEEDDNADGQPYAPPQSDPRTPTTPFSTSAPHSRTGSLTSQNNPTSPPLPSNLNARRAPTPQERRAPSPQQQQQQYGAPPPHSHSSAPSFTSNSSSNNASHAGPPTSLAPAVPAGNDVVVPNKSTMMVEEPSSSLFQSSPRDDLPSPTSEHAGQSSEDRRGSGTLNFGSGGRNLLASPPLGSQNNPSREQRDEQDREEKLAESQPNAPFRGLQGSQGQQQGHQSRASETSSIGTRFFGGYAGSAANSEAGGRRSMDFDSSVAQAVEKVKSEYEYKLTMLQNRVDALERENDDAAQALRGHRTEQEGKKMVERELSEIRERYDEQANQLHSLQQEHDVLRSTSSRSGASPSFNGAGSSDSELRSRLHESEDLANELRGELSSLVDEVRQANERCEELQQELDGEREKKEKAEKEAGEWKTRWQQAKLELRNIKATSQLFSSSISVDADYMPASSDGLIKDTSVADFQTSIDDLLQAARSKEPSSVLPAARAVVSACEKLDNDIQAIPQSRLASLTSSDQDLVNSLKGKVNATLSNLMTASKNHAMSFGVSPVSLLDAAASHLAATIVELVRILKIRRSTGGSSGGGNRMSLGPSDALGFGGRGGYNHEPMPPLPEFAQPEPLRVPQFPSRGPSPDVGPDPPVKERDVAPAPAPAPIIEAVKERSAGYLSGGMNALLGGGAGSVSKALEAMGISSGKRSSVDSQDERGAVPPASSQSQQQHDQQQPRESLAFSGMSLDSSARGRGGVSPQGPPSGLPSTSSNGYLPPQRFDSFGSHSSQQQQQQHHQQDDPSAYPQYAQPPLNRDNSTSSLAYRSNPPSQHFGQSQAPQQQQQRNDSYGEQRNAGPASYDYGGASQYQSQGEQQQGQYGQHQQNDGYGQGGNEDDGSQYGSPALNRSERHPDELKAYIETQTENIVHSIQSLLSAIRSGAQGSDLTDHLTQIITIVSSIVAISQEALPSHARSEGDAILDDLTTHCDKLSEMQNGRPAAGGGDAFTKQTKQAMAAASFGVAKSLKQLNSLLQGQGEEGLM